MYDILYHFGMLTSVPIQNYTPSIYIYIKFDIIHLFVCLYRTILGLNYILQLFWYISSQNSPKGVKWKVLQYNFPFLGSLGAIGYRGGPLGGPIVFFKKPQKSLINIKLLWWFLLTLLHFKAKWADFLAHSIVSLSYFLCKVESMHLKYKKTAKKLPKFAYKLL